MSRITLILLSILILLPAGLAQDKKKSAPIAKKPSLSGFVKIELILTNESVFQGLADKNRMVEHVKRYQYVKLDDSRKSEFNAGIRLWFYDGLAGFLFFPYRRLEKVVVGRELTVKEMERVRTDAKERRNREEAENAKRIQAKAAAAAKTDPMSELDAKSQQLLDRWAPKEGWTEQKFEDLQKSVITEAYKLTDEEAEWAKVYPDWLRALRKTQKPVVVAAKKKAARPSVKPKAKLIAKKKAPVKSKPGNKRADIKVDGSGRITTKIKRPKRKAADTSAANRGIR